jgi:hypothetical protein
LGDLAEACDQLGATCGLAGEIDLVELRVEDGHVYDVRPAVVLRGREGKHDDAVSRRHVLELFLDAAEWALRTRDAWHRSGLQVAQVALAGQVRGRIVVKIL